MAHRAARVVVVSARVSVGVCFLPPPNRGYSTAQGVRPLNPRAMGATCGRTRSLGRLTSTVSEVTCTDCLRTLAAQAAEVLAAPDLTQTCPGCAGPARVDQEGRLWCSQCEDNWG